MSETEDLSKIERLGDMVASPALRAVLKEVHPLAQLVVLWQNVPTSGSAVCRYNIGAGTRSYEIRYQYGDIGNLVHELTHVAVNEAYELDFINYSSPNWNSPTLPARQYDTVGHCTNEDARQTRLMDGGWNSKVSAEAQNILMWTNASGLPSDLKNKIAQKVQFYTCVMPHKEFDTVINQILVWLFEWGYPIINYRGKKPVANALFEEVERSVNRAYQRRRAGRV